jgi:lipopolysaccharide biosynthesis glycosyltransferase
MIRIFAGYDRREEVGFHVFASSLIAKTSKQFTLSPLVFHAAEGTNAFTYSRFEVAKLCNYQGKAIFVDGSDMIMAGDIAELWDLFDDNYAVQVVKHNYKTSCNTKYIGTEMESPNTNYQRKQWASVMLINCEHPDWQNIDKFSNFERLQLKFTDSIGELPIEWNWLVDEFGENDNAKILHWTLGVPGFKHYVNSPMNDDWFYYNRRMNYKAQ